MEEKPMPYIHTVVIVDTQGLGEAAPWISAFTTQEKADEFTVKARGLLNRAGSDDRFLIIGDSGSLDSMEYLDWLAEELELTAAEES